MSDQEFERLAAKILDDSAEFLDVWLFTQEYNYRSAVPQAGNPLGVRPMAVPMTCQQAARKLGPIGSPVPSHA